MSDEADFHAENNRMIARMMADPRSKKLTREWVNHANSYGYSYHFTWMGRPIIQYPQDMIAMQELIWALRPDLIIETGVARGGSLIFYASLLELIGKGEVLGIDIKVFPHNREAIENHPMSKRISIIEGSSVASEVIEEVRAAAKQKEVVLVCLDSNHTHDHVLRELELYSPLVTKNSFCVVFDTIIEELAENAFPDRPWGRGDNPLTAVHQFLRSNDNFVIDDAVDGKLLITVAPSGYLRRVK